MHLFDRLFGTPSQSPSIGELIHWDESFSVGNGLLDNEHRDIARVLNSLYRHHCTGGPALDSHRLLAVLDRTVRTHFANEEDVLARHRCPTLAAHQAAHGEILADLAALTAALPGMADEDAEAALAQLVRRIVLNHILVTDMEARDYLRE